MLALVFSLLCAPPGGQQALDLREGTLTYVVVHKLHKVDATTFSVHLTYSSEIPLPL